MTTASARQSLPTHHRLALLDFARGLAVVCMAIYHFSWDLTWFALVDWPVAQGTGWRVFAAGIAGSFLFLAGVSLELAHHQGIRWRSFWRREAVIVCAAAAVSVVTYFVFNDSFVRFGILHAIAASSLIALPFTRAPIILVAAASVFVLTLSFWASGTLFDGPAWAWTGLGETGFASVDYVPVAPWAGATLAGVCISKLARGFKVMDWWQTLSLTAPLGRVGRWLGCHSLAIYLLHQPVLFGVTWLLATALFPGQDRLSLSFVDNCARTCEATSATPDVCRPACSCTLRHMKVSGVWDQITVAPNNQSLRADMNRHYALCLADPER